MDELKMLKNEIEVLKTQLRRLMEDEADIKDILKVNYAIDDLINQYYCLNKEQ